MPCTAVRRKLDQATSETELRQLWTRLGISTHIMERAVKLKQEALDKRKPTRRAPQGDRPRSPPYRTVGSKNSPQGSGDFSDDRTEGDNKPCF
jgi:hypothetical protein